jgi:hypothetical protein
LVVSSIATSQRVAAQATEWATLLGGVGSEVGYSVATDHDGSVVVTGSFDGPTNIGGAQLGSAGNTDVFVAKFSRSGGLIWAKRLGGISADEPAAAAVDQETGDVVVTGRFSLIATVDDRVLQSAGGTDVFLARFSKSGTVQWALALGGEGDDAAAGVAVDPNGDSLVTGQFGGQLGCGQTVLTSAGGTDIFVASVSLAGALHWCRRVGGFSDDTVGGIAVGDGGLFALTGTFGTSTDLGGGTVSRVGLFDAFVAGYAVADGGYRWARRMGGSGYDVGTAVAFDPAGAAVVSGYFGLFGGGVDFGGGVRATRGGADAFVAKYNGTDGAYLWAETFGGNLDDYANAVSVDPAGNMCVTGEFQGSALFGGRSAASRGQFDAFAAAVSPSGAPLWWRSYGDVVNDKAYGVAADVEGSCFITGFSVFRVDLGRGALYSAGMADAFLAKLAPAVVITPVPTRTFTPTRIPPTPVPPTRVPPTPVPPTPASTFTRPPQSTFTPPPTVAERGCTVDCNDDGAVTINELIAGINIVLGQAELSTCAVIDADHDGTLTINEVVSGVKGALTGCPE